MHLESFKINHGVALFQQMPNCNKLHILLLNLSYIYNLKNNCVTPYGCIQLLILDTCALVGFTKYAPTTPSMVQN